MSTKTTDTTSAAIAFTKDDFITEKDGNTLMVTVAPETYERNRPEGLTHDMEVAVDTYRQDYVGAVITGLEDLVSKSMKKDKGLEHVVVNAVPNKSFQVEIAIDRERNGFNPKTREPLTIYGSTVVRVKTSYRKVGVIKKACTSMSARIKDTIG